MLIPENHPPLDDLVYISSVFGQHIGLNYSALPYCHLKYAAPATVPKVTEQAFPVKGVFTRSTGSMICLQICQHQKTHTGKASHCCLRQITEWKTSSVSYKFQLQTSSPMLLRSLLTVGRMWWTSAAFDHFTPALKQVSDQSHNIMYSAEGLSSPRDETSVSIY